MNLLALLLLGGSPPNDVLTASARLDAGALAVTAVYEVVLNVKLADGWSASKSGMPNPLLQLSVPDCVTLEGRELTEHADLSRNEFLHAPFELLIEPGPTRIRFTLNSEPGDDDRFALNVIAYVSNDGGQSNWLVRRRLELPVAAGAEARGAQATRSNWGAESTFGIGDKIEPFDLPQLDGQTLPLADVLGTKNVVITTMRPRVAGEVHAPVD